MICIPVVAPTIEEALRQMRRSFSLVPMVELRVDAMNNVDMARLLASRQGRVLVTNRKRDEGGCFIGSEHARCSLLREAVEWGADFVDIELSTRKYFVQKLKNVIEEYEGKTEFIISHHDFDGTPPLSRLKEIIEKSVAQGADIVKVVTWATNAEDNLKMMELIAWSKKRNQRIIGFCMGKEGRISRVVAPCVGSFCTFASIDRGLESAPGQLTVEEMKELLRIVNDGR